MNSLYYLKLYKIVIYTIILNFNLISQENNKQFVTIDYLNFSNSLYKRGDYFYKDNASFFGISKFTTCAVFYTTLRGYHIFSFGEAIATYYLENRHIKLMYGTEIDYKFIYIKLGKIPYLEFIKENTDNGKLKSIQNLRIKNKIPKIYCGLKSKKKHAFRYKLVNRCN